MKGHFTEDIWTAKKHMLRRSTSLVIKEMQMKPTMKYQYTPMKFKTLSKNVDENVEQLQPSHIPKWYNHLGEQFDSFFQSYT